MIIAPYSTDAPLYHLPITTGTLIVVNIVIFFATTFQLMLGNVEEESLEWLILQFDTINPLQWITGAFMHGDFMHLMGNMFFLWAFGLVVEGKIGSLPFLGIYMAMAAVDGAAVQLPMFLMASEGGALGASGVIFALMIIAMLWAPENEMDCFYFVGFYFGTFEVRIVKLGAAFVMLQLLFLFLSGFSMSSEMLHIIGALIGLPVGVWMLRKNLVDCEGWDVISRNEWLQEFDFLCTPEQRQRLKQKDDDRYDPVTAALATSPTQGTRQNAAAMAGAMQVRPAKSTSKATLASASSSTAAVQPKRSFFAGRKNNLPPTQVTPPDLSSHPEFNRLVYLLRQAIASKSVNLAQQHYARLESLNLTRGLSDQALMSYVGLLASEKRFAEALGALGLVSDRGGELANQARIRIAQIQLKVLRDPKAATQALANIRIAANDMTPENQKLVTLRDSLLAQASG